MLILDLEEDDFVLMDVLEPEAREAVSDPVLMETPSSCARNNDNFGASLGFLFRDQNPFFLNGLGMAEGSCSTILLRRLAKNPILN